MGVVGVMGAVIPDDNLSRPSGPGPPTLGAVGAPRSLSDTRPNLTLGRLKATLLLPPLQHNGPGLCHPDR